MSRILTITLNPALDLATQVERLTAEAKMRCSTPRLDPGGGGVNVSRAIARLGGRSTALVALGGAVGARHAGCLAGDGIETVRLDVGGETRESLAVTDRSTGRMYRFVMPGPSWEPDMVGAALARIAATVGEGDLVVLSGSHPPGVPDDFALRLLDRVAGRGVRLVLDVSGPALLAAARGGGAALHVLRMNAAEAATLRGGPAPDAPGAAALGRELLATGAAEIVVIGLGAAGSVGVDASGAWRVRPPPVEVVSRTGAGDSFVAGLVLGFAEGLPLPRCLERAMAAATSAVTTPGTALCTRDGTAAVLAQIAAEPLGG